MKNNLRRALTYLSVVLIVLLFFSRSIRYWMIPKVMLSTVSSGTIIWRPQITNLRWSSSDIVEVITSPYLPDNIKIVNKEPFQVREVVAGEKLILLDNFSLDQAISVASKDYVSCYAYEVAYRRELENVQKNVHESLLQAEAALKKSGTSSAKRKKQIESNYQLAKEDYDLIVTQGIYNGTTLEVVRSETQSAQARLEALEALRNAGNALISPCDGLLISWSSEIDSGTLQANCKYFEIIPNNALRQIIITLDEQHISENAQQVTLVNRESTLEHYNLSIIKKSLNPQGFVEISLTGELALLEEIDLNKSYILSYESEYYKALVPNAAFITSDTVYVVKSRYNNGHWQQIVQDIKVSRGKGNAFYTPVTGDIQAGDQVIISWDRPIEIGQAVIASN